MFHTFTRIKVLFLAVFLLIGAGLWGYDALYVWPRKACEAKGHWWDPLSHSCAVPVSITVFTHRPITAGKAGAAAH
jgi:hypothetical protein